MHLYCNTFIPFDMINAKIWKIIFIPLGKSAKPIFTTRTLFLLIKINLYRVYYQYVK